MFCKNFAYIGSIGKMTFFFFCDEAMTHSKNNNFKKGQKVNKLDCLSSLITLLHLLEEKKNILTGLF